MAATRLSDNIWRIGTRASPLARAQAGETRRRLIEAHQLPPAALEITVLSTQGDRIQDRALSESGGKGLFTKELDTALLEGRIDLAVHSMKDVATHLPDGVALYAFLPREDVRDGFISLGANDVFDLPVGATIGSASLRRRAQVKRLRADLRVVLLRGNVQTRLKRIEEGAIDATFLALAGLNRLGLTAHAKRAVEPEQMLPAAGQGAIGVAARSDDDQAASLLAPLNCLQTEVRVTAERAFLARLDGSCRTPIAALAGPADHSK